MITKFHLSAAALAGVLVCSVAGAQGRDGASSVRLSSVHADPAARALAKSAHNFQTAPQSAPQARRIQVSPSGRITSEFAPTANLFDFDNTSGVPGLGFDFPHLAAISGGLANNSSSRFGRHGHGGQGTFVPILFGGYPYYYDDPGYDQPEQQSAPQPQPQPQIIVIQQPAPAQQAADSGSYTGNPSASVPASQADVTVPDVGDFIFFRRDGRVLFASVFSVVGSQLQYVNPEGIRHSLALSDVDADATQQMNEARGTTVQIHN
jgi:hypothetical protein